MSHLEQLRYINREHWCWSLQLVINISFICQAVACNYNSSCFSTVDSCWFQWSCTVWHLLWTVISIAEVLSYMQSLRHYSAHQTVENSRMVIQVMPIIQTVVVGSSISMKLWNSYAKDRMMGICCRDYQLLHQVNIGSLSTNIHAWR